MTSPDEKLPKREHLLKTGDFRNAYKNGRSLRRETIALYVVPNSLSYNRIGFSIRRGAVKLASRRNRIRRCLREIYRRKKSSLVTGVDLVLVIRRDPGSKISYEAMEGTFLKLASDAGLIVKAG